MHVGKPQGLSLTLYMSQWNYLYYTTVHGFSVEPEVWTVVAVYRDSTQGPHLPVTFREDSTPPCQGDYNSSSPCQLVFSCSTAVSTAIPTADSSGETSVISNAGLLLAVAMQL